MPTAELEHAPGAITAEEIDCQLAKLLDSHHFRHSQRYPALLRYLVEHTQTGKAGQLKERLLGIEVFRRAPDYDTNTDPVVRVTAAEVRKRIAQYYQEPEHTGELRIELPTGSYIPRFSRSLVTTKEIAAETEQPDDGAQAGETVSAEAVPSSIAAESTDLPSGAGQSGRRNHWWAVIGALGLGILLAVAGMESLAGLAAWREQAVRSFWAPMSAGAEPILVLIGDHTVGSQGNALRAAQGQAASPSEDVLKLMNEREQVPITDVMSVSKLTDYMVRHNQGYRLEGAGAADVPDLRNGPVVLFAGLDNRWTMRLAQHLRYRFVDSPDDTVGTIVDSQTPGRVWQVDFKVAAGKMPVDYAIVARYFDPLIEQPVMMVAGVGATGTISASEFVTSERMIEEMNKLAPKDWKHGNVEIVLAMPVIDGHSGAPHIVAAQFW